MSKSASALPSSEVTRPFLISRPGFGSFGLLKAAKPFSASSTAKRSSRSGRSSQSAKRRQRLAPLGLAPLGLAPLGLAPAGAFGFTLSSISHLSTPPIARADRRRY